MTPTTDARPAAMMLRKEQAKAARESLEMALAQQLRAAGINFRREIEFHPTRRFRFDFVVGNVLAVEVEGGVHSGGRHTRGAGFTADCEKTNEAACLGWRVLRVTADHIRRGWALNWIERALKAPRAPELVA